MNKIYNLLLLVFFFSCQVKRNVFFIGTKHALTTTVDVYFFESSIKKPYEIIGKIGFDKNNKYYTQAAHEKYVLKAKEVGADGILYLENLCQPKLNTKTNVEITQIGDIPFVNTSATSSFQVAENSIYLIKYK